MIQSMTGYGKTVVEYNGKKIHVELKSLNSKALDMTARVAPIYREKEMEIRQMVQQGLERGKVDILVWVEKDNASSTIVPRAEAWFVPFFSVCPSLTPVSLGLMLSVWNMMAVS